MAAGSPPARRTPNGRRRGRPPGSTNAVRVARHASVVAGATSEPPPKKRRYIPGGPGGGGRFVDSDSLDIIATARPSTAARSHPRASQGPASPSLAPRRARSSRIQGTIDESLAEMRWGSAAAMAASVKQAEDYKPREERSWEEFHPNLNIEAGFMVFRSEDVDGPPPNPPDSPAAQMPATPRHDGSSTSTPARNVQPGPANDAPNAVAAGETPTLDDANVTPSRRSRRPTNQVSFYTSARAYATTKGTPKAPKIQPIQNQTAKEKLDLKLPSFRKTNRIELFETKFFGQARYVDKSMSNVGYQESDNFIRPDRTLIKAVDIGMDDDLDPQNLARNAEDYHSHHSRIGRVEYDMDEQDDMWLDHYNEQRKQNELEVITREVFEITLTKIEKEWHALEKRIPKPNPKPPQTHRPRSSSAAAVNGETQAAEEPDSKCAVCDDGDCENTNAIVFCDGCNLAVHQECYGVPFIPEGQWLCRKCQLCGRGVPTCIFCPNTDGAFKQTNSSKWAHLLCAMWIPEVSLGNHTFMEPVMEVEKVPKNRWKLSCYICNQKMGACIQCSNKNCYQAFHVTCARKARLFLKMKTAHGALAVLDGSMILKAFCDKHCPPDYTEENRVASATKAAKRFYRRNMKGRIWADSHAMANAIAVQHRLRQENGADGDQNPDGSGGGGGGGGGGTVPGSVDWKRGQGQKNIWRLPSGAPVIPQTVFETVDSSIQRFPLRKRKEFLGEACRYWTLKREARRGAALLKRLQLQMDSFTSMELTRRNFAAMGPGGKERLTRRIEFTQHIIADLEHIRDLSEQVVNRESTKLSAAELEHDFVDEAYFPVMKSLAPAVEKAISLDKELFAVGLLKLQEKVDQRLLVDGLSFAQCLGQVITAGIIDPPSAVLQPQFTASSTARHSFADIRERRKLGRRILKAVQPLVEAALRLESEAAHKSFETLQKDMEQVFESCVEVNPPERFEAEDGRDTIMVDPHDASEITVRGGAADAEPTTATKDDMMDATTNDPGAVRDKSEARDGPTVNGEGGDVEMANTNNANKARRNGLSESDTPPGSNAYMPVPELESAPNPPTPPQSNGSLGKEPGDLLAEGGILWYMKAFEPLGTSVGEEHWAGRDAVRALSEELTDLDDDEIKGLRADVENARLSRFGDIEPAEEPAQEPAQESASVPVNRKRATRATTAAKRRRVSTRRR